MIADRFSFRVWKGLEKRLVYNVTYLNPLILDPQISEEGKHNVIMQSVGLRDKNDKLIYESDLLRGEYGQIYQVIWWRHGWIIRLDGVHNTWYPMDKLEVVGNIYENPELLKGV